MFAVGGRLGGGDRLIVEEKLKAMIHSPWEWWMKAYSFPVVVPQDVGSLRRFEAPRVPDSQIPMALISDWVEFFLDRSEYRKAWALLTIVYFGEARLPEIETFQWQGFPHQSPLWVFDSRRSSLFPSPPGPITRALSFWYALNGGPGAKGVLTPDFSGMYRSWVSLSGPYARSPWGNRTPEAVYRDLHRVFEDLRGATHSTIDALLVPPPEAKVVGGIAYVRGVPLMRASVSVSPPQDDPWGEGWLSSLEGIPEDLLEEARSLRDSVLGRTTRRSGNGSNLGRRLQELSEDGEEPTKSPAQIPKPGGSPSR